MRELARSSAPQSYARSPIWLRGLRWFVGLVALALGLYFAYAIILWTRVSNNQAKWLNAKATSYTITERYSRSVSGSYAEGPEVIRNGQVIEGHHEFDKPIIDWAFDHA